MRPNSQHQHEQDNKTRQRSEEKSILSGQLHRLARPSRVATTKDQVDLSHNFYENPNSPTNLVTMENHQHQHQSQIQLHHQLQLQRRLHASGFVDQPAPNSTHVQLHHGLAQTLSHRSLLHEQAAHAHLQQQQHAHLQQQNQQQLQLALQLQQHHQQHQQHQHHQLQLQLQHRNLNHLVHHQHSQIASLASNQPNQLMSQLDGLTERQLHALMGRLGPHARLELAERPGHESVEFAGSELLGDDEDLENDELDEDEVADEDGAEPDDSSLVDQLHSGQHIEARIQAENPGPLSLKQQRANHEPIRLSSLNSLSSHISLMAAKQPGGHAFVANAAANTRIQPPSGGQGGGAAAASPNSTGCPSDSCSRSSSSGTSSVSPQPSGLAPSRSSPASSMSSNEIKQTSNNATCSSSGPETNASKLRHHTHQQQVASSQLQINNNNSSSSSIANSSSSIFELMPELAHDGLNLSWFHGANSRARLQEALSSPSSADPSELMGPRVLCADVSLAEMSRYPLPIMARAPLGVSDITLESWICELIRARPQKPVKLTFGTTRAVEPAFRVLARHADGLQGPLILAANILAHPSSQSAAAASCNQNNKQSGKQSKNNNNSNNNNLQAEKDGPNQPVDAWTFLMLCRTRFPRSTISIGWCDPEPDPSHAELVGSPTTEDSASALLAAGTQFELDLGGLVSQAAAPQRQTNGQQLNGSGRAGAAHRLHPYQLTGHHRPLLVGNQIQATNATRLLSSSASLNSSSTSGNSSGASSPTSPIGHQHQHHQTGAGQLMAASSQLSLALKGTSGRQAPSASSNGATSLDSSSVATPAPAHSAAALCFMHGLQSAASSGESQTTTAAAALAAAVVAASSNQHQQDSIDQQLPLNLNINEADSSITSSGAVPNSSLGELAQRIQNYNQHLLLRQQLAAQALTNHNHTPNPKLLADANRTQQQLLLKTATPPSSRQTTTTTTTTSNPMTQNTNLAKITNCYSREMIDKMAAIVKEYSLTQPITFPVEAKLVRNSLAELQRLLYQVGASSSLTIVANASDLIHVDDLIFIRNSFAPNQIMYDLPDCLASALKRELEHLL